MTTEAVRKQVTKLLPDVDKVAVMRMHRADVVLEGIYDTIQAIRRQVNDKSADVSIGNLVQAFSAFVDKYQLLTGAPTASTEVKHTGDIQRNLDTLEPVDSKAQGDEPEPVDIPYTKDT